MRIAWHVVGSLSLLFVVPSVRGEDGKPADTLAGLQEEYKQADEELARGRRPGTTEGEKVQALADFYQRVGSIGGRGLKLADACPESPEDLDILLWVVRLPSEQASGAAAAYDRLALRHLNSDKILLLVRNARHYCLSPHVESFVRAAAERSTNRKVQGQACLSLGQVLHRCAALARALDDPLQSGALERNLDKPSLERLRAMKPEALSAEAKALYERTLREFADIPSIIDALLPTLGEQAEGGLYRLKNLEVGCTAPEIEGEDLNGLPWKLSETRGKVVMISFWATWCGPCMSMVPDEKALVERMKGRPFALVGVNGDEDRGQAKSIVAREGISWRSFWGGGPKGPLIVRWGVTQWPTVYLIDAKGVIRAEGLYGAHLEKAIETLVAEAD